MDVKSLASLLAVIGMHLLIAVTPASAAKPASVARPSIDALSLSPALTDGLAAVPGEVIESPPPPPTETIEYYAVDAIGSTRVVFAPDGTVLGRVDYLPFGEELPGANAPAERFTGASRDPEAAFDHFDLRSYQSRIGRFSSMDPVVGGGAMTNPQLWNRYAYALNAPLRYVDPTGLQAEAPREFCPKPDSCLHFADFDWVTGGSGGGGSGGGGQAGWWVPPSIGCPFCSGVAIGGWGYGSPGAAAPGQAPATGAPPTTGPGSTDGPTPPPPPPPPPGPGPSPGPTGKPETTNWADLTRTPWSPHPGMIPILVPNSEIQGVRQTQMWIVGATGAALAVSSAWRAVGAWAGANLKVDGPSAGYQYSQGRLLQVRYQSQILLRLDLHPRAPGGAPTWHVHILPPSGGEHGFTVNLWPW